MGGREGTGGALDMGSPSPLETSSGSALNAVYHRRKVNPHQALAAYNSLAMTYCTVNL